MCQYQSLFQRSQRKGAVYGAKDQYATLINELESIKMIFLYFIKIPLEIV